MDRADLIGKLFPAVPTLFDSEGKLDGPANESYADYMSSCPVDGVAVWVHTGRGPFLNEDEKKKLMSIWKERFGDGLMIAGVGVDADVFHREGEISYLEKTVRVAEMAKENGADAILVFPPKPFEFSEEKILEYHRKISEVGLPMILFYLYREAGGIEYGFELLEKLLRIDEVVGVKLATLYSVIKMQDISNFVIEKFPSKVLITGEDRMFGYSLMRGSRSALIGIGSVLPEIQKEMMRSFFNGKYGKFFDLMIKVDKLAESLFVEPMEGYIERIEYALFLLGIVPKENVHDPYGPGITDSDRMKVRKVLTELGYL